MKDIDSLDCSGQQKNKIWHVRVLNDKMKIAWGLKTQCH